MGRHTKEAKDQRWRLLLDFPSKDALIEFVDDLGLPSGAEPHHADALDLAKPCHQVIVTRDVHPGRLERDEPEDGEAYLERWKAQQARIDHEIEHGKLGIDKPPLIADDKDA
jgi:hypothetical protein